MRTDILVVDDEAPMRRMLAAELEYLSCSCTAVGCVDEAARQLERRGYGLVLTDLRLADGSGLDVLARARALQPEVPVVLLSGRGTIDDAVAAMKRGATDFLIKPIDSTRLAEVIQQHAVAPRLGRDTQDDRRARTAASGGIVGQSPVLETLLDKIWQVAAADITVLVQGESGTGKELVARALHECSPRRPRPFVALDCGALESNLLVSELFGHMRGAFTGAEATRQGLFQAAHGGTLFLDEIGNLSLELQTRLLRVLQERKVRPVGGDGEREVDVRVIAATNHDLRKAVADGSFRQDLYYRLAVVTLVVPPLRDRGRDVTVLARHFIDRFARRMNRGPMAVLPSALARLDRYAWPGNVRELANIVERAVILATEDVIREFELPEEKDMPHADVESLDNAVRRAEADAIRRALRMSSSKAEAARRLGISRRALYDKLDKLAIGGGE